MRPALRFILDSVPAHATRNVSSSVFLRDVTGESPGMTKTWVHGSVVRNVSNSTALRQRH